MNYNFVGEDEHTFTVRHPDGSDFTIAKQAVGPGVHKRIKELEPVKMFDGGKTSEIKSSDNSDFVPEDQSSLGQGLRDWLGVNKPTEALLPNPIPESNPQMASSMAPATPQMPEIPQVTSQPVLPDRAPSALPMQQPQIPQVSGQQPIDINNDPFAATNLEQSKALKAEQDINAKTAGALNSGYQAMAQNQNELQKNLASNEAHYAPIESGLVQKNQVLSQAVTDQKIDHNRLWSNMSTGNKVLAAISVALSGIGAGLQGGNAQNMAMGVIQKSIDRDIDDQKAELGKKQTLFSENLRQLGDIRAAKAATASQLLSVAQAKANMIAAQNGSAEVIGRMQIANKQIDVQKAMLNRDAALNSFIYKNKDSNPDQVISILRRTDPQKAKEMEGRYVPGIGIGSVPVPEKTRDQLIAHQQLSDAAKDLQSWVKINSTVLPGTQEYNVGAQKAQVLQQLIRHGQLQTVYREGEQPLLDKMVNSNPAGFLKAFNTEPKLRELIRSNDAQFNTLKKGYGLPQQTAAQQLNPQEQSYLQWAKQNPNDPRSAAVLRKLGVQ